MKRFRNHLALFCELARQSVQSLDRSDHFLALVVEHPPTNRSSRARRSRTAPSRPDSARLKLWMMSPICPPSPPAFTRLTVRTTSVPSMDRTTISQVE